MNCTIRKAVNLLNNVEESGGYWLPNIQRQFVWSEEQICKLFDSVMRRYPISTMLAWRTKSKIKYRRFPSICKSDASPVSQFEEKNDSAKYLVLDGQQRLQSFYIGLKGSLDGKKLCFNVLSNTNKKQEAEIKYEFKFIEEDKITFPFVTVAEIVASNESLLTIIERYKEKFKNNLDSTTEKVMSENLDCIRETFTIKELIHIELLDSVENPALFTEDDIVEIFIRCNSGGTKLSKSDLLFSLLANDWDSVHEKISDLLDELNKSTGFEFDRDFILKVCLSVLKKGAAYKVTKFRDETTRKAIEHNWKEIGNSVKEIRDYLLSNTYIRSDAALSSYLALIPLIYLRYNYKDAWNKAANDSKKPITDYLCRVLLCSTFSGGPDAMIDGITDQIDKDNGFVTENIYDIIKDRNRIVDISEKHITEQYYGGKNIYLIFALLYKQFNFTPAYKGNVPQEDHVFPQSALKKELKVKEAGEKRARHKYGKWEINTIGNLMLLSAAENGASGKTDTLPEVWFADKDDAYLEMHSIPKDKSLWKIEKYSTFVEERKKILVKKVMDELKKFQ